MRALQADDIEIIPREIYDHVSKARLMIVAPRELLALRDEQVELPAACGKSAPAGSNWEAMSAD